MKNILFIISLVLFCAPRLQSQNFTVTGKVVDAETKSPLEYATVTFKPNSSKENFGAITNEKGNFEVTIPKGKYTIIVEYLAYKTITFKSQNINNNQHYGSIELSEDVEIINDLVIKSKKKLLEFKPKKTVYNITEDISAEGSSISDALNNIPSVNISDGKTTIMGKEATIMVNGKTSSLSKDDVIKSLPAGSVEKVEVIKNPGAQYNAEYKSIINIIMKKGKNKGLNASFTGSGGFLDVYGGLITLNNKTEKINFYTNVSYSHRVDIITSKIKSKYFTGGITSSFLNENSEFNSHNSNFISSIGADYYLSKNTTISGVVNYTDIDDESETITNSSFLNSTYAEIANNKREHSSLFDDESIELIFDIEHKLKKEGSKLISHIKYLNNIESETTSVINNNNNFTDLSYHNKNQLDNTEFDIKFKTPIAKKSILTVGYNGDFGKLAFRNNTVTKVIDYTQNVHGAFVDYEYETQKFYFGVGVRKEFSNTSVVYLNLNTSQNRNYNDIFPSLYSQYSISDSKSIVLSHSRNISRPDYERIQPFEQKFSETSSYVGNELLKPILFDITSLTYSYYGEKITLVSNLYFQKWSNYWKDVTYETGQQINGVNKLITTPQNVGWANIYGIDFTAIYRTSNTLNFTFNSNIYNFYQYGIFETVNTSNQPIVIDYNNKSFDGNFKLVTQINFPYEINFQTSIFHYLKSKSSVSMRRAYTYTSMAFNKKILEKKGSLSLTINDVFNSKQTDRDRFSANYFSNSLIKNKYPDILLSFTYRFNNSKSNKKIDFKGKDKKPNY